MQMILDTDDMRDCQYANLWRMSVIREKIDKYNHRQRRVSGPVRSRFWWCSRPPTEASSPSPASSGAPIPSFAPPLDSCTDGDDAIHDDVVWGAKPVEGNPTEKRWVANETMLRYNQQSWPTHTKQHCHCHCKYQTYGCQAESTFGCSSLVCSTFGNWRGASASLRHLDFHPAAHIWQLILPEEGKWISGCKMEAGWWEVMEVSHRTAMTIQLKTYVPTQSNPIEMCPRFWTTVPLGGCM